MIKSVNSGSDVDARLLPFLVRSCGASDQSRLLVARTIPKARNRVTNIR